MTAAGADCVVITPIGGHFCIGEFKEVSPLPVISMLSGVAKELTARGLKRIAIMERALSCKSFYGGLSDTEVITPQGSQLEQVLDAHITIATASFVTDQQRQVFDAACRQFLELDRVEAILLGGTDLALVHDAITAELPLFDGAAIHVDAITEQALSKVTGKLTLGANRAFSAHFHAVDNLFILLERP